MTTNKLHHYLHKGSKDMNQIFCNIIFLTLFITVICQPSLFSFLFPDDVIFPPLLRTIPPYTLGRILSPWPQKKGLVVLSGLSVFHRTLSTRVMCTSLRSPQASPLLCNVYISAEPPKAFINNLNSKIGIHNYLVLWCKHMLTRLFFFMWKSHLIRTCTISTTTCETVRWRLLMHNMITCIYHFPCK